SVLMERQFRYPLHRVFIEFPAGKIDPGEDTLECAKRELKEETDLDAEQIELIGVYEFMRKNELIIAYYVKASGTIKLSPELLEYR
ncbi:NUDIX hydrolase, partial [Acinetobacter baumannii]